MNILQKKKQNLDQFCGFVGRSRAKKLSASGGLRPPDPPPGTLPLDPLYRLALHALAMGCAPPKQFFWIRPCIVSNRIVLYKLYLCVAYS